MMADVWFLMKSSRVANRIRDIRSYGLRALWDSGYIAW